MRAISKVEIPVRHKSLFQARTGFEISRNRAIPAIRVLRRSDFQEIRELALKVWLDAYKGIYKPATVFRCVSSYYSDFELERDYQRYLHGRGFFIVAVIDGCIVGYACVGIKGLGWELQRLYVDPEAQGQGVGSLLLQCVERRLKRVGATRYAAHPHGKNKLACQFYRKKGFVRIKERDRGPCSPCFLKGL